MIQITYFQVLTGKSFNGKEVIPTGTIEALVDGKPESATATGNGPVNALYKAVDRLSALRELKYNLRRLNVHSAADGSDAEGEARVVILNPTGHYESAAKSTDIVEAALFAYVGALNKMLESAK